MQGFHSENSSEYATFQLATPLERLRVAEITKSHPRRSSDNGLAESKNGSVIRNVFVRWHTVGAYAERLDHFHPAIVARYLNYHRPYLFAQADTDAKCKQRRTYRPADIRKAYEALKALPGAACYQCPKGNLRGTGLGSLRADAQTDHASHRQQSQRT